MVPIPTFAHANWESVVSVLSYVSYLQYPPIKAVLTSQILNHRDREEDKVDWEIQKLFQSVTEASFTHL